MLCVVRLNLFYYMGKMRHNKQVWMIAKGMVLCIVKNAVIAIIVMAVTSG